MVTDIRPRSCVGSAKRAISSRSPERACVAVVGDGRLASVVAARLCKKRYRTVLLDPELRNATDIASGLPIKAGYQSVFGMCEFVINMVEDDESVLNLALRLSAVLGTYSVHMSLGPLAPETARRLANLHQPLGQQFLSVQIPGKPDHNGARDLLLLADCDPDTLHRCLPLLACL